MRGLDKPRGSLVDPPLNDSTDDHRHHAEEESRSHTVSRRKITVGAQHKLAVMCLKPSAFTNLHSPLRKKRVKSIIDKRSEDNDLNSATEWTESGIFGSSKQSVGALTVKGSVGEWRGE